MIFNVFNFLNLKTQSFYANPLKTKQYTILSLVRNYRKRSLHIKGSQYVRLPIIAKEKINLLKLKYICLSHSFFKKERQKFFFFARTVETLVNGT